MMVSQRERFDRVNTETVSGINICCFLLCQRERFDRVNTETLNGAELFRCVRCQRERFDRVNTETAGRRIGQRLDRRVRGNDSTG